MTSCKRSCSGVAPEGFFRVSLLLVSDRPKLVHVERDGWLATIIIIQWQHTSWQDTQIRTGHTVRQHGEHTAHVDGPFRHLIPICRPDHFLRKLFRHTSVYQHLTRDAVLSKHLCLSQNVTHRSEETPIHLTCPDKPGHHANKDVLCDGVSGPRAGQGANLDARNQELIPIPQASRDIFDVQIWSVRANLVKHVPELGDLILCEWHHRSRLPQSEELCLLQCFEVAAAKLYIHNASEHQRLTHARPI